MKYLKIFTDFLDVLAPLTDEEAGSLYRAMLRYAQDGTEPDLVGNERFVWAVARQHMDREAEAYREKVASMGKARSCLKKQKTDRNKQISGEDKDKEKEKENDNDNDKDKDSLSTGGGPRGPGERENRPSLEEVIDFSQEAGIEADVTYFYNYYEANGWRIGKYPIRDWRAALRAWSRKAPQKSPAQPRSDAERFRDMIERMKREETKQI